MGEGGEDKGRGPSRNSFIQQKNKVHQLLFTPTCVGGTLAFFGLLFIVIGIVCVSIEGTVQQTEIVYSDYAKAPSAAVGRGGGDTCHDTSDAPCLVVFELEEDMEGPVYFYYSLTNFYQNHRRYLSSKSDVMTNGRFGDEGPGEDPTRWITEECTFSEIAYWVGTDGTVYHWNRANDADKAVYYYPCGLVARSAFNDTFGLWEEGAWMAGGAPVNWTTSGISWEDGADSKYVSKSEEWLRQNCYSLGEHDLGSGNFESSGFAPSLAGFSGTGDVSTSRYHCWRNVSDETFRIWMRTALLSNFWKLHRIIPGGLKKGIYHMEVGLHYSVWPFKGTKGVVLSNATPLGTNRRKLSVAYLVVGAFSLFGAFVVAVLRLTKPRAKKPTVEYPLATICPPPAKAQGGGGGMMHIALPAMRPPHVESERVVVTPIPEGGHVFATNFVSTSKYTMLSFVPLNLMLQFQRTANLYFLCIAVLASISIISPLGGSTFWIPLITVLGATAVKDGAEDYRRHQSDLEENNRQTEVLDAASGGFKVVPWWEVRVGDLVRVTTIEDGCAAMLPCDLVLIASSSIDGTAFLETANLDGETNLKLRDALEIVQRELTREEVVEGNEQAVLDMDKVRGMQCKIHCHPPDMMLYEFNARIEVFGEEIPLNGMSSGGQFLQRSTKLKNTKWVLGACVYTGRDTKIQMNMNDPPNKVSDIEKSLNSFIFLLFGMLFTICTVGAIGAGVFVDSDTAKGSWYLMPQNTTVVFDPGAPAVTGLITWLTYLILLSLLIPISLYVSIEMVKTVIMLVISADREMYVEEDDLPSKARSSGLCEELGQVSYIFSDKTGTLTQNLMEFKKCSVAGVEYGEGYCEVERAIARKNGSSLPDDPPPPEACDKGFKFVDDRLLFGKWREEKDRDMIEQFFFNLMVNHTAQVEYGSSNPDFPLFQAESPDEGAFVSAARNMGFFFTKRMMRDVHTRVSQSPDPSKANILHDSKDVVWTLLASNAFDNNRKRTSIVIQEAGTGKILLLVKGADTSVMPFVENECPYFDTTQQHIDKFGDQGLRTLVFAGRELSQEQWGAWDALYQEAAKLPEGREAALQRLASTLEEDHRSPGNPSALFDASTPYQKTLKLHGVTALEDKLQVNVGDCIAQLAKAMIKIWVLTGDKVETAINIGYATALLLNEMEPLLRLSQDELLDPEDGWRQNATPLELALQEAIDLCSGKDVAGVIACCERSAGKVGGGEGGKALEQAGATARKLQGGPEGAVSEGQVSAQLGTTGSKLKEALLRERVRKELQRIDGITSKPRPGGYALVIDGPSLRAALAEETKMLFLQVSVRCKAVMCCRVTPSQKALVTLLVKDNMPGQITLAIGDGANDVSMIQAAHIGVGIRGKEGQQAVLAADYALPRFCFLERLLLIHGRWSYNRIGTMVCYFFYKNITFAMCLFWFALANAFSAQALYDDGYQSLYNVVFTSLPVMVFAVFDRDLEPEVVQANPELYSTGQWNVRFNKRRFATFILGSIVHSLLLYYVTVNVTDLNVSDSQGAPQGLWGSGTVVLTSVIITVNVVVGLHTRSWSWVHWLFYVGSIGVWFLFLLAYHAVQPGGFLVFDTSDNIYWLFFEMASSALYWLTVLLVVAVCCLPILAYKYLLEEYWPGIDDYYRRVVARPQDYPGETIKVVLKPAAQAGGEGAGRGGGGAGGGGGESSTVSVKPSQVSPTVPAGVYPDLGAEEGGGAGGGAKQGYSSTQAAPAAPPATTSGRDAAGATGEGSPVSKGLARLRLAGKEVIRRNRQVRRHAISRSDYTPPADRSMQKDSVHAQGVVGPRSLSASSSAGVGVSGRGGAPTLAPTEPSTGTTRDAVGGGGEATLASQPRPVDGAGDGSMLTQVVDVDSTDNA